MSAIQLSGSIFYRAGDATVGLSRTDPKGLVVAVDPLKFNAAGSITESTEVDIISDSYSGAIQMSYFKDFYNRIHFTPQQINFNTIASDTYRQVSVWNAYLVTVDLDVITPPAAANVAVFAGPSLPHIFKPLATALYTFVAYLNGPSSFYLETDFDFDNGDFYSIPTLGDRAVITEIGPNWNVGVTERLDYKTEIVHVSRNGREQRRALRQEPRREVRYNINVWNERVRDVDGTLTKWRRRTQLVALSPYRCRTSADAVAGATVLPIEGVMPPWVKAGVAVKFSGRSVAEGITGVIQSFTSGTITLTQPIADDMPQGTLLIRAMTGRLKDGTKVSRVTDRAQSVQYAFEITPGVDPVYDPAAAPVVFRGYELFLEKPNWRSALDVEYEHELEIVDFDRGVRSFFEAVDFTSTITKLSFSGRRGDKIQRLIDFYHRQLGQLREFYYPTWGPDIVPKFQLDQDNVNIRVSGFDLALDYQNQTTHRAVLVQLRDGTFIPAAVEAIYTVSDGLGDDSVIQVVDAWAADYPVSSILKISWLMRSRLASDVLEVKWLTDEVATIQLAIKTLEHLE